MKKYTQFRLHLIGLAVSAFTTVSYAQVVPPAHPSQSGLDAAVAAEYVPGTTDPSFDDAERISLCLAESVVGLVAAHTDHHGCADRTFSVGIETFDVEGPGTAVIDGGVNAGGTTLSGSLSAKNIKGVRCDVDLAAGLNQLRGTTVSAYAGRHAWGRKDAVFNSRADIRIVDPQNGSTLNYGEENILDYYKRVINNQSWEFDWGLEKILKNNYPRTKWTQLSWYRRENGDPGYLKLAKYQVAPRSARGCRIEYEAEGFNGSGEFQYSGTLRVFRQK